jgi:hypothetical protein
MGISKVEELANVIAGCLPKVQTKK